MLEMIIWSLFVGSLGVQVTLIGGWQRWQHLRTEQLHQEEEEILTRYESQEYLSSPGAREPGAQRPAPPGDGPRTNGATTHSEASKDPRMTGWEFKIVRASKDLFREAAVFQRLCKEESESGWILLEKLDDRRVRFKRPLALRDIVRSEYLNHDPYRTHYGPTARPGVWLGAIAFLTVVMISGYLGYALVSVTLSKQQAEPGTPVIPATPASPPS